MINLPKLKTHKKAGITCALKNLIGINGNKEYLPHHRVGGPTSGGDCYPGGSLRQESARALWDRQNMASSFAAARVWHGVATQLDRLTRLQGDRLGVEGSWSGNDTIWRTCLDLNRILLYGRADALAGGSTCSAASSTSSTRSSPVRATARWRRSPCRSARVRRQQCRRGRLGRRAAARVRSVAHPNRSITRSISFLAAHVVFR